MATKRKITFVQILTVVMIVLAVIWEKNVQEWFTLNPGKADIHRVDLFVIVPLIVTLLAVSIFQLTRKGDEQR
ncbi:hypothetical protein EAX61_14205 [Dokdonia sinensis]|uniref:Uncharacterized protein n=1 Tax=Dokdonia sinensis TaxID=2479847 RepID=A0A3M0FVN4_9FLAO|nr:hypothetical protein [Dokdonia sinensis]RMB56558.1 hypothetical protein EAX61_14205 [Dokdonia sinensis]